MTFLDTLNYFALQIDDLNGGHGLCVNVTVAYKIAAFQRTKFGLAADVYPRSNDYADVQTHSADERRFFAMRNAKRMLDLSQGVNLGN